MADLPADEVPSAENFWRYTPHLSNELDEQRWAWMRQRFSQERIEAAFRQLGNRRPFLANLMNIMGQRFPDNSALPRTAAQIERHRAAFEAHRDRLQQIVDDAKARQGGA